MEHTVKSYRDLVAWQRARELVRETYGCNEIFMQSQRVLPAESAKAHAEQSTCLRSLTR